MQQKELTDKELEAVVAGKTQPIVIKKRRGDAVSSFAVARAFGGTAKTASPSSSGACGPNGCPA